MEKIKKTSEQSRAKLRRASAQSLPDRPTAAGMKPDDLRRALWNPMLGEELSLLSEQDRIVDETNKALSEVEDAIESERASRVAAINDERADRERAIDELGQHEDAREAAHDAEEASYREGIAAELDARVKVIPSERKPGIYGQVGETTQLYRLEFAPYPTNTVVMRSPNGCIYTETDDEEYEIFDDVNHLAVGKRYRVVNIKYLQDELKKSVTPRLDALETALSGTARSYVIEDLEELSQLVNDELSDFDVFDLITGDNILLRQKDAPDFWFESAKGKAAAQAPVYTHTEYDGEGNVISTTDYRLSMIVDDEQIGVLHVLESDYSLIEGKAIGAGKAAQEAKAAAQEARDAVEQVDVRLAQKVDKVPSLGKEYTVAAVDRRGAAVGANGMPIALAADVGTFGGAIPLRDYYGRLRVGTTATMDDYHAVSVGYLNKQLGDCVKSVDDRISVLEDRIGELLAQFITREGATVIKPDGAKRYAQIGEIHGAISTYRISPNVYDYEAIRNYPVQIVSDKDTVVFEIPEDVVPTLPHFGVEGNSIFFDNGKAYYKQTTKLEDSLYSLSAGETTIEEIQYGNKVVKLSGEIVTDISERIPSDGVIDVSDVTSLTVKMKYSQPEVADMVVDGALGTEGDYDYRLGKMRIAFEV